VVVGHQIAVVDDEAAAGAGASLRAAGRLREVEEVAELRRQLLAQLFEGVDRAPEDLDVHGHHARSVGLDDGDGVGLVLQ